MSERPAIGGAARATTARRATRRGRAAGVLAPLVLLAACSGSGSGSGSGSEAEQGDSVDTEAGDCSSGQSGADVTTSEAQTFTFDGQERQYLLALPEDDGGEARPLVIDFHGHGGDMAGHAADSGMAVAATTRGYVVVTPQALGDPARWNFSGAQDQPDDFGFVHALIADLGPRLCIDAARVFVAGHSNGSAFSGFLACREPYEIAAVAMVSATTPVSCPDGVNPAVLAIHGTDDPTVPYEGGGNRNLPPAPEIMAAWAEHHGCSPVPIADNPATGSGQVERSTWDGCSGGSEVVLDTVVGGRHAWPGGTKAQQVPEGSEAGRTFPATTEILDFFDRHSREVP